MQLNVYFLALALAIASIQAAPLPETGDSAAEPRALAALGRIGTKIGTKLGGTAGRGGDLAMAGMQMAPMAMMGMNQQRSLGRSNSSPGRMESGTHSTSAGTAAEESAPSSNSQSTADESSPSTAEGSSASEPKKSEAYGNANAIWGAGNTALGLAAAGFNTDTLGIDQSQQNQKRGKWGAIGQAFKDAKTSDFIGSGDKTMGTISNGLSLNYAINANQMAQENANGQQKRDVLAADALFGADGLQRRLNPLADVALMALGNSGATVQNQNVNEQGAGNGNKHISGASSGLGRRLINIGVGHESENEQGAGNGNAFETGASSGIFRRLFSVGVTDESENEQGVGNGNVFETGASSGLARRLFSVDTTRQDMNEQMAGNQNVFHTGASSGISPAAMAALNGRGMAKRLFGVTTTSIHQNEQGVGNQNGFKTGASSGISPAAMAALQG